MCIIAGGISDANSVHPDDIHIDDDDDAAVDIPTPSTSVQVHTALTAPISGGSRGGYGSLSRSPQHDDNPEYRGAVGGVGAYLPDENPPRHEAELRGIVSSDPDDEDEEEDAEPANRSLRVKIISLFKSRRSNRRRRRDSDEEA